MRILPQFTNSSKVSLSLSLTYTHTQPDNYFRSRTVGTSRLLYEIRTDTRGSKFVEDTAFLDNVVSADTKKSYAIPSLRYIITSLKNTESLAIIRFS